MIICDDIDLFGGRISIISTHGFCCQIETAGERLRLAPSTVIHDLLPLNASHCPRPVATLTHDVTGGAEGLLARHQTIVDFLDRLARSDARLQLSMALGIASREFKDFGNWKWPEGTPAGIDSLVIDRPFPKLAQAGHEFHKLTLSHAGRLEGRQYQSHADSPLAD